MKSLARANIGHQWKLFLAAISVLTLSGCLIYVAVGISVANIRNFSSYFRNMDVDYFVVSSLETKRGRATFSTDVIHDIKEYSEVEHVEAVMRISNFENFDANGTTKRIFFVAIDPDSESISIPRTFDSEARRALKHPGNIILSNFSAQIMGKKTGDTLVSARGGQVYKVVGIIHGEMGRAIYGDRSWNFVSPETANMFSAKFGINLTPDRTTTLGIRLKPEFSNQNGRARIDYYLSKKNLKSILPSEFAHTESWAFIREDKNFQGFLIIGGFAVLIPLFIIVQTLRSAIMAQNEQFATLRALGVPSRYLISTAMEQALWVGILGASLAFCIMQFIKWRLFVMDISMYVPNLTLVLVTGVIIAASLIAGLISLFAIFKTQPQELLR